MFSTRQCVCSFLLLFANQHSSNKIGTPHEMPRWKIKTVYMLRNLLDRTKQDTQYALRSFGRAPGFTAVVIITLALGIGATSAIFSIVNAVLLHPLPYPNADRLVVIWEKLTRNPQGPPVFDSYTDFEAWKARSHGFEQLAPATWATGGQILTGAGRARDVLAMPVGIDFFHLLGARPSIGRFFQADDLQRSCIVVLKHQFWMSAFGGQRDVVGRHISLSEKPCTVVGVAAPGFTFYPEAISMWMLITPASQIARDPANANVGTFGLLKPGVSIARAQQELTAIFTDEHRHDAKGAAQTPVIYPLAQQFAYLTGPNLRLSVIILFAAVVFVLLIACVNIANLLLSRALVRQKELAVRAALGSGRLRLIRQLLTEGLLLSFAGALGGILLALWAVHYFRVFNPIEMPPGNPVTVNLYVVAFTACLAMITALIFGLAPALKASKVDLIDVLKANGRTTSSGPAARMFGKLLVSAEIMLSLALLVGAGLLIESINRLASVPLGFRTARVSTLSIELPEWNYAKPQARANFFRNVVDQTRALPGLESAAFASSLPLNNGRWRQSVLTVQGKPEPDPATAAPDIAQSSVTPDYFRIMGVTLAQGRSFEDREQVGTEPVAVINEALAQKYFPHENPIGRHIKVGQPDNAKPWLTIVGVVSNEKDKDFFNEMSWEDIPLVLRPLAQDPPERASLVLLTRRDDIAIGAAIQKEIAAIDNTVPVGQVETLDQRVSKLLAYPRFRASLLGAFAALALLLATIGLYGVLSHLTAQRTQEFGVRMALGAQKHQVLSLVVRQGLWLTGAGIVLGIVLALSLTRLLSGLLYDVQPTDPWILAGFSLLLLLTSVAALYLPARRAAKVDPLVALRYE